MKYFLIFVALSSWFQASLILAEDQSPPWKKLFAPGTQIVFVGDSITHGFSAPAAVRGDHYHGLLQVYFATRFPSLDLWISNAGRAGDNLTGLLSSRMDSCDLYQTLPGVADFPKVAFILYGMNDGGSLGYLQGKSPSDAAKEKRRKTYTDKLNQVVANLNANNVMPVILSPTMYDETANKNVMPAIGYNAELAVYKDLAQQVAMRHDLDFVDMHTLMTERTVFKQQRDPDFSYTNDRVHPHSGGAAIMFYSILQALRPAPDVFRVHLSVDSSSTRVIAAMNTTLSAVALSDGSLAWDANENALPFPINTTAYRYDHAFDDVPFVSQFNQQWLQVTGLPENRFVLTIDDNAVATLTSEALANGIDLSVHHSTPQYQQAFKLRERLFRKQTIDIIKRDLNSTRLNMEAYYRSDPVGKDATIYAELRAEDWNHPNHDTILSYLERQIQQIEGTGRPLGSFFSHISKQTRAYLPEIISLNSELLAIRGEIMALPASRTFHYLLTPVSDISR